MASSEQRFIYRVCLLLMSPTPSKIWREAVSISKLPKKFPSDNCYCYDMLYNMGCALDAEISEFETAVLQWYPTTQATKKKKKILVQSVPVPTSFLSISVRVMTPQGDKNSSQT